MPRRHPGSIRIFTAFGVDVFLHWSWLLVAYLQYQLGPEERSPIWHLATYVSLFGIVLLHEYGHALACRSVGGRADQIVLWPLGGIAFVQPPPRPGAVLWSIAAGPLVNVALLPLTVGVWFVIIGNANPGVWSHLQWYVASITTINVSLLVFNLLPIYPLDGGQIVQSILWFFIGRAKSLMMSASIGLVCAVALGAFMLWKGNYWLVLIACFIGWQAWRGLRIARVMTVMESMENDPWRVPHGRDHHG